MLFILSKIVGIFLNPLNIIIFIGIILSFSVLLKFYRLSFFTSLAFISIIFISGFLPFSYNILNELENDAWSKTNKLQVYANGVINEFDDKKLVSLLDGVLVLGGGVKGGVVAQSRNESSLNEAGERMTKAIELFNKNNSIRILFSGYSGKLFPQGWAEYDVANKFFLEMGVPKEKIILEKQSKNTYENLLYSMEFFSENEVWGLVTSASHMKRAKFIIEKLNIKNKIIFFPVDFKTADEYYSYSFNISKGSQFWQIYLHERVGLIAYEFIGLF